MNQRVTIKEFDANKIKVDCKNQSKLKNGLRTLFLNYGDENTNFMTQTPQVWLGENGMQKTEWTTTHTDVQFFFYTSV